MATADTGDASIGPLSLAPGTYRIEVMADSGRTIVKELRVATNRASESVVIEVR